MDDLKSRQELYNGFGDTLARGFELAVMPVLFGGIGWLLDRVFGLTPVLTILFAVFCLAGMAVRMYYGYDTAMRAQEAKGPWAAGIAARRETATRGRARRGVHDPGPNASSR